MGWFTDLWDAWADPGGVWDTQTDYSPGVPEPGGEIQPEPPPEKEFGSLTAEQWFTPEYHTEEYAPYWEPFTAGGTPYEELATQYAGMPVVSGYWTTDPTTGEKTFTPTDSLYSTTSQLYDLRNTELPSFDEWMGDTGATYTSDLTQTDPYAGITGIVEDFNDLTDEMQSAMEAAALANGFVTPEGTGDGAAYLAYMQSQREEKDLGVMGQQGVMGTEYETAARKATQSSIEQTVEANMQMVESLGMASSAAAYSKMNEVSNTIQNMTLQADVKLLEQDLLMRQMEYEALLARSEQATQTGMAGSAQYLDMLVNNRMQALQGYATQLNTIVTNNAQTLEQYGMELERITAHAKITYDAIMVEIGYDEHLMQQSEDLYNQYMTPYWDAMEQYYREEELRIADKAADSSFWGDLFNTVVTGIFVVVGAMIAGPAGAVAGGVAGDVVTG